VISSFSGTSGSENNRKMSAAKQVYIASNGCNRRLLDADRVRRYFLSNGWKITESPKEADYNLFFASALNRVRIDESFDIIERLTRFPGETIVLGCVMEVAPGEFRKKWKGKFLAVKDMNAIDSFFPAFEVKYRDVPPGNTPARSGNIYKAVSPEVFLRQRLSLVLNPARIGDKLYSYVHRQQKENYDTTFIWVSNGCPNKCSFCAERKVIGDLQSRPVDDIVSEYGQLLEAGRRNFEFIGDDVGSYGLDINSSFPELVKALNKKDKGYNVHWVIKHLHPKFIIKYQDDLIDLAKSGKVKEIICCFQSGSNRLLELMNRQHTIEAVKSTLRRFRQVLPDIKLATNIIVGFPTETDEEFQQTLDVFDEVYFDRVHMIKYYDAEGSDSHELNPKISNEAISRRIQGARKFFKQRGIYFQTRD
jgi:MiaB/RimO family radical SAM methylthiotransferase